MEKTYIIANSDFSLFWTKDGNKFTHTTAFMSAARFNDLSEAMSVISGSEHDGFAVHELTPELVYVYNLGK